MARIRSLSLLLLPFALAACDDGSDSNPDDLTPLMPEADGGEPEPDPDAAPEASVWCEGATAQMYDPFVSTEVDLFPDDALTREDADSPTGLRLDLDPERVPWVGNIPRLFGDSVTDMSQLSGFGLNGAIIVRFTAPVEPLPDGYEASMSSEAVMLFDLDAEPPTRIPYTVTYGDAGATAIVQPMHPMRAGTRHGLIITNDHPAADGDCVAPSETLKGILGDAALDPRLERVRPGYAALLSAAGVEAGAVSAATVFTTHREMDLYVDILDDILARDYAWDGPADCEVTERWRKCEGSFEAWDYRDDLAATTPTPKAPWTLKVSIWLPLDPAGPVPTLFVGHGLGSGRGQAGQLADLWTEDGYAIVAMDAMRHGDHPLSAGGDGSDTALSFLGLNLSGLNANGRQLVGNFNQTLVDRLQGLRLIRQNPDVDGDGTIDLDVGRIGYYGVSLGGLLGPGLAALDPHLDMAVWQVPGGHLSTFITASEEVEGFLPALSALVGGEDRFYRMLPLLQAAIDPADPATWALNVMRDRLGGGGPLDLLVACSTGDNVVPPPTGVYLARALRLNHIGAVIFADDLLPWAEAPAAGNAWDGESTAGYTQFDRVTNNDVLELSEHANMPLSLEAQYQARAFIEPWVEGGEPQIIDPYAELGTPALELPLEE